MRKTYILFIVVLFSFPAFAQLSGDIEKDNRKIISNQNFTMEGNANGKIVFEIAVNSKGEISSAKVLDDESSVKSTPTKIKAYNYVKTFKFEPGTWFPKYHQGKMVITIEKKK